MPEPKIRDRLVGGWRLTGFEVTPGGQTEHPLGDDPPGTILYTPDGYMSAQLARPGPYEDDQEPDAYYIAYSGPYDVDEQATYPATRYALATGQPYAPNLANMGMTWAVPGKSFVGRLAGHFLH